MTKSLSETLREEFWSAFYEQLDADHGFAAWFDESRGPGQIDGDVPPDLFFRLADAAQKWSTAGVSSLEELQSLQSGSIIMDSEDEAYRLDPYGAAGDVKRWYPAWVIGRAFETDFGVYPEGISLPAQVLYRPESS